MPVAFRIPNDERERKQLTDVMDEARGSSLVGSDAGLAAAAHAISGPTATAIESPWPIDPLADDQFEWSLLKELYARACSLKLGLCVMRDDPLIRALLTNRDRVVVCPFAGPKREGDLEDWAWDLGAVAACYDVQRCPVRGNLQWGHNKAVILEAARVGWVDACILAIPCESFTCMRLVPIPADQPQAPPLRLRSCLPDLPPCPEGWEPYLSKHEAFVAFGWDLAAAVLDWASGRLVAEHPVDRGDEAKIRFFREQFAEHAPLSLHPGTIELMTRYRVRETDVVQCMSRCEHEKGTTIFADEETSEAIAFGALPCVHQSHKECSGTNPDGSSVSEQSSYWTSEFNRWLMLAVLGGSPAAVREAALDAAEIELLSAGISRDQMAEWQPQPIGEIGAGTPLAEIGLGETRDEGVT